MSESRPSSGWFSKVILALVAVGVAACLVWMALPAHVDRGTSPQNACINNLRLIDGATWEWVLEHNMSGTNVPTWADISPYLTRETNIVMLHCPSGGKYTLGSMSNVPTCSIPGHALP